jgi:hypothetical protein
MNAERLRVVGRTMWVRTVPSAWRCRLGKKVSAGEAWCSVPEAPKPVGVRLSGAEWALVLESLRRFALELDEVGRPDRALEVHRALSKLVTYRVMAGADAVEDEAVDDEGS